MKKLANVSIIMGTGAFIMGMFYFLVAIDPNLVIAFGGIILFLIGKTIDDGLTTKETLKKLELLKELKESEDNVPIIYPRRKR